jgi:hypothetical protein
MRTLGTRVSGAMDSGCDEIARLPCFAFSDHSLVVEQKECYLYAPAHMAGNQRRGVNNGRVIQGRDVFGIA